MVVSWQERGGALPCLSPSPRGNEERREKRGAECVCLAAGRPQTRRFPSPIPRMLNRRPARGFSASPPRFGVLHLLAYIGVVLGHLLVILQ
jgi:hypothetical protein